jgi:hypothetical protein
VVAAAALLIILFILWIINRVASVALELTGLTYDAASFQARSALLGVGFTTSEAELIVQHPVRRKIVMLLMLIGNTGIISAMVSVLILFLNAETSSQAALRLLAVCGGVLVLWLLARSPWLKKHMLKGISWALRRWTHIDVRDYDNLMQLSGGYHIVELTVGPEEWYVNMNLRATDFRHKGLLVLGIYRSGEYIGTPKADTVICAGDKLILYGQTHNLDEQIVKPHTKLVPPEQGPRSEAPGSS